MFQSTFLSSSPSPIRQQKYLRYNEWMRKIHPKEAKKRQQQQQQQNYNYNSSTKQQNKLLFSLSICCTSHCSNYWTTNKKLKTTPYPYYIPLNPSHIPPCPTFCCMFLLHVFATYAIMRILSTTLCAHYKLDISLYCTKKLPFIFLFASSFD